MDRYTPARVDHAIVRATQRYIEEHFGAPHGHRNVKPQAAKKVWLIEENFMYLMRLKIIAPYLLSDELSIHTIERFMRPERKWRVLDTLAFNTSFRGLQSRHPDWPKPVKEVDATTFATTSMLDALGFEGAGVRSSPHAIRNGNVRGPRETDPREKSGQRQRDGLYYNEYVYNHARAAKHINAKRLYSHPLPQAEALQVYTATSVQAGPLVSENGTHMDLPQDDLVQVGENLNNLSMPLPPDGAEMLLSVPEDGEEHLGNAEDSNTTTQTGDDEDAANPYLWGGQSSLNIEQCSGPGAMEPDDGMDFLAEMLWD